MCQKKKRRRMAYIQIGTAYRRLLTEGVPHLKNVEKATRLREQATALAAKLNIPTPDHERYFPLDPAHFPDRQDDDFPKVLSLW